MLLSLLADQLRVAQSKQRALSKLSALGRQPTLRHGLQRLGYRRVLQQGLASGWEESELSQALRVVLLAPCLELRLHIRVRVLRVEKQSIDAAQQTLRLRVQSLQNPRARYSRCTARLLPRLQAALLKEAS